MGNMFKSYIYFIQLPHTKLALGRSHLLNPQSYMYVCCVCVLCMCVVYMYVCVYVCVCVCVNVYAASPPTPRSSFGRVGYIIISLQFCRTKISFSCGVGVVWHRCGMRVMVLCGCCVA